MIRATYMKNAIVFTYSGIICFTGTSILIFLNVYSAFRLRHLIITVFLAGLFLILVSAVLIILETRLFYKIISLEKKS